MVLSSSASQLRTDCECREELRDDGLDFENCEDGRFESITPQDDFSRRGRNFCKMEGEVVSSAKIASAHTGCQIGSCTEASLEVNKARLKSRAFGMCLFLLHFLDLIAPLLPALSFAVLAQSRGGYTTAKACCLSMACAPTCLGICCVMLEDQDSSHTLHSVP